MVRQRAQENGTDLFKYRRGSDDYLFYGSTTSKDPIRRVLNFGSRVFGKYVSHVSTIS